MRSLRAAAIFSAAFAQLVVGQERLPQGYLFRGPLYSERPVALVEPESGLPLTFSETRYSSGTLTTTVRSRTIRTVPVSGITLRAAYGPTTDGMVSFRMRPQVGGIDPGVPVRITPDQASHRLAFRVALEDPHVTFITPQPPMRIVFTLERVDGQDGFLIFENPHAVELLWEALGRPSFTQQ